VSALIHAATMVTAGINMVARCTPIFAQSAVALDVVLTLGVIGAVLTATMALAQHDMKRILAYSTISHLRSCSSRWAVVCRIRPSFHVFTHAVVQGAAVPGSRQRDARDGRRDRRAPVQRPAARVDRAHLRVDADRLPGAGGLPAAGGVFWSKDEIATRRSSVTRRRRSCC
jgi:NADH-quinone oxidoreductase subunit L